MVGVRYIAFEKAKGMIRFKREIILKTGEVVEQICQMPDTTFSIRAGEYGLDPITEADAVWDIILNESHLMHEDEDEPHLVTAETLEEARDKILTRCRNEKKKLDDRKRPKEWTKEEKEAHDTVLEQLRQHSPIDPQMVILHREIMKRMVKNIKQRRAAGPEPSRVETHRRRMIDEIRQQEGV